MCSEAWELAEGSMPERSLRGEGTGRRSGAQHKSDSALHATVLKAFLHYLYYSFGTIFPILKEL